MFFLFPWLSTFIVTSAEYKEDVPIREQQEKAYKEVLEKSKKDIPEGAVIPMERVLILWKDLPDEKYAKQYLGHSEEWLLYMFGRAAASLSEVPFIYIDSLHTLYNEKKEEPVAAVLRRINILREATGNLPILEEDGFFDQFESKDLLVPFTEAVAQATELSEKDVTKAFPFLEMAAYNHTRNINQIYYKKFFSSINALLAQIELPFDKEGTGRFIHQYFNWQSGNGDVKACSARLEGVSAPSFYRYIPEFESSFLYAEYLKAYQHMLKDTRKQGNMPDCIPFMAAYNQLEGDENRDEKLLQTFPEIAGEIDVPRIKLACDKKIALLKRKGLYRKTLKEYGLESL